MVNRINRVLHILHSFDIMFTTRNENVNVRREVNNVASITNIKKNSRIDKTALKLQQTT